ncbi:ParA family protein [Nonomuraea sp. SYSU D8015]|uniref:ParA family protein n=1 Tax=Nonomuraea sp. SYSU D8015 TaxID=2593644 RepID=UPI001660451C|nr:ParA family protein [Nonomuraea sp. SYSU D8015]
MAKEEDTVTADGISVGGFTRGSDEKTAVNLAAGLALHGQRVIIADLDAQGGILPPSYDCYFIDTPPALSPLEKKGQSHQA